MTLHATTLFRSDVVTLTDVRCDGGPDADQSEGSDAAVVVLPRAGAIRLTFDRGGTTVADANHAWFLDRGDEYRVRHGVDGHDASTVVALAPDVLDELRGGAPVFRVTHALVDGGADLLHRRLVRRLGSSSAPTALAVEEVVVDLARRLLGTPRMSSHATPTQQRAVVRAQELLTARAADPLSLAELARDVGLSPWHLSRTFHRLTGVPIRAYLLRLRARMAVDRLLEGEPSITRLAHELAFADHSHLTQTIRRETGLAPRDVRRLAAHPV